VGRHGLPTERAAVPWELVGWGVFACLVAAGALVRFGGSWTVALLVVALGGLAIAAIAVMAMSGSSRPRRPPPP
jgi:hypothetical protein